MPAERRGANADAAFQVFRAQIGAPFPGGDDGVDLEVVGAQPHALGAKEAHRPNVGAGQVVGAHRLPAGVVDFGLTVRQRHAQDMGGTKQPVGMGLQAENRGASMGGIGPNPFEHTHAVVQGMGQYMGVGLAPRHQFAVVPDQTITVGHRHRSTLQNKAACARVGARCSNASPHARRRFNRFPSAAARCGSRLREPPAPRRPGYGRAVLAA